jgi:membrane-associated phospholipid phosphatase
MILSKPVLQMPSLRKLRLFLKHAIGLTLLFVTVYGGCNWVASQRLTPWKLYWEWETRIPFVPAMILIYFSLNILIMLPLFALDESGLRTYTKVFAWATVIAGAIFLVIPTKLGFERVSPLNGFEGAYQALFAWDRPHNLFPSLHIGYSTISVLAIWREKPIWFRSFLVVWLALICVSVVLVHQHHLADIAGGLLLGWGTSRMVQTL